MSIWSLQCLSQRICRQAYILANSRMFPAQKRLPVVNDISRTAHNSLYHMVKKRTLEARTKLQANKYPNHTPCVTKTIPSHVEPECDCDDTTSISTVVSCRQQEAYDNPAFSRNICETTQVLRATSKADDLVIDTCKTKQNVANEFAKKSAAGGGPCGPLGGRGGGNDEEEKKRKERMLKCLLAMLAALGLGGFLAWLLFSRSKKCEVGNSEEELKKAQRAGLVSVPAKSEDLPKHVPYLLIGGGTAAFSAFRAIKSNDATAKVLMITNEFRKPYMRPPLSKELWYTPSENEDEKNPKEVSNTKPKEYRFKQWTGAERSLYFEPDEFFVDPAKLESSAHGGIAVAQGFTVKKVDPANRIVTLNDGYEISYDECLIATGCSPKNLIIFRDASPSVREKVMVYRTPEDFDRLRRYAKERRTITIVGNGFIGSELACSLAHFSKEVGGGKVYQIFQEAGNMSKVLPNYLSRWTMQKMEALGVTVIPNASIKSTVRDDTQLKLELNNGSSLLTDIVVICVGCTPNTGLAQPSGLEIDRSLGGFVVNAELEARRNLYVAGDASCFYDPLLGRRRVEHHDHSVVSGRLAGENMTGKKKPYTHQSMFWSDLGPEIGYEGIGLVDSSLPTVGVFALPSKSERKADNLTEIRTDEESGKTQIVPKSDLPDVPCTPNDEANYGKGVIFYLKDDKIVGILLWNLFNRIGLARTIINQDKKYDDLNEVAKLFEIHT